jgi:hypothetical protein
VLVSGGLSLDAKQPFDSSYLCVVHFRGNMGGECDPLSDGLPGFRNFALPDGIGVVRAEVPPLVAKVCKCKQLIAHARECRLVPMQV